MAESGALLLRPGQDVGAAAVHWLPIKTSHTGPCKVDEFFKPEPSTDQAAGAQVLEAHLRGRHLKGVTRQLPAGYAGVVVAPGAPSADSSADERPWCSAATFGGLTYWNHDAAPAASDWQARCLDWLALADKVHAPVSLQAVEEELQRASGGGSEERG
ncbi:MAG: ribonuclease H2 non-catalytic subunit-domain-containing protein [Monoraphidium minutum]|nr:MAG: ribonuclease H2 non-catalytic subunit-domain-containing protein [Monoraphidium minutum]